MCTRSPICDKRKRGTLYFFVWHPFRFKSNKHPCEAFVRACLLLRASPLRCHHNNISTSGSVE